MGIRRAYLGLLGAAAIVCTAGALVAYATDALRGMELASVDTRFAVRGDQGPPDDLLFVEIDDETFSRYGNTVYPFPRSLHADVIRNLDRAGARAIAYDVQFTEPGPDPADDNELIQSVRAAGGRVILATTEVEQGGETRIFGGGAGLRFSRGVPGYSNFPNEPGGVFRRLPYQVGGLKSFSVATAEVVRGVPVPRPPDDDHAFIDFPGPPGTVDSISFWRVQRGRFPASLARGKVVVVGASAPSLQDLHPTSTTGSDPMPGPEIQAAAIDTVLRGYPLQTTPGWIDVALIVLLGMAAPVAALRLGTPAAVVIGGAALAAFLVGAQIAFDSGGWLVAFVYPVGAGLLSIGIVLLMRGITAVFEREQVRQVFARFVPEAVVGQALERADGARLGGVRQKATVLFSDLRGFTSFSERREPDEVIEILNEYLTEMSAAILDHGGTLVSYIGDGIMAVFGAPIEQDDHAERAVAAAREMLDRLAGFNASMVAAGKGEAFKMGIGLNTGYVMSGNVGSDRRLEYTVIGDVTNTAARLEGMTKGTPHQLYLAESTRALLDRDPPDLVRAGDFEVRGREARIVVWTLTDTDFPGSGVPMNAPQPEPDTQPAAAAFPQGG